MSVIQRLPYLTPTYEHIEIGDWHLVNDEDVDVLGELLPNWDPALDIRATVEVKLNLEGIYQACRLKPDAVLRLAAVWESPGTVLKGRGAFTDVQVFHSPQQAQLTVEVEGIKLASKLNFTVNLILLYAGAEPEPLAPKMIGSILAQKTQSVLLEGEGARFPTEVIDFKDTHYPSEAGWALYWDPDNLEQTVSGEVRLFINSQHQRIVRAVSKQLPEDYGIREAMRFDLARTLIYGALGNSEFVEEPDNYKYGTIGASIRNMLRLYFPETSFSQLRANSLQPQSFDPKLQDRLRVFWEE